MRLLKFGLNETQLGLVKASLAKLEGAHRTRVAWFGDDSLVGNLLSIHALDLLTVLSHCKRNPESEMDLYRLRKSAMDKLNGLAKSARNEIKRQNYEMWLESYKKLWPGSEGDVDLRSATPQPSRFELIP
ncbi:MAG: hypothetical protein IPL83_02350 [Bdellovibrionales bacterium]|nr:hypothetical protein [Bdellovibrionales bacterium]